MRPVKIIVAEHRITLTAEPIVTAEATQHGECLRFATARHWL